MTVSAKKKSTFKEEPPPESLITWIFQDDFIPRAKLTKDGCYSIFTDYLGTPVGAYDEAGNLVWERELDINGKVMPAGKDNYGRTLQVIGEKTFIPFRFQGQYEDEEIGLYYNRFRYYDPETGQYTQQDPIGLAGGNPTLYGYVYNTLGEVDPFGLNNVEHFVDFDAALRRAFEIATGGDDTVTFTPKNVDLLTGTEVEFLGSNNSKIAFDSPHPDMSIELGHNKPHIGVQTGGKRGAGGAQRVNLTYDGEQHPYRSSIKGEGNIPCH